MTETFGGSKLRAAPLLRGVYLTSGIQEGTPVDRLTGLLARAFGVSPARLPSLRPERGRSYFLHRLLAEVMPGEAMLVSSQPAVVRRRLLLRGGGFAAVTIATLAACAVIWQLRAGSLDQQRRVEASLKAQTEEAARHALDPVADTDLPALLPLLDQARDMPFVNSTRTPGSGLRARWARWPRSDARPIATRCSATCYPGWCAGWRARSPGRWTGRISATRRPAST